MCGLTGFLSVDGSWPRDAGALARRMADTLMHRGPDDDGIWLDEAAGVALAHRRLAILDLSPAGHQPMASAGGRYVIAYNGEIYNHVDLRRELNERGAAPAWRGHSDTETLLAAFETWGIESALKRAVGMFALALWDRQTRTLTFARDRFGEKPFYYGWAGGALLFGSELKALRAFPGFVGRIERRALALYLRHNAVPAPWSIYQDVWKLPPGCLVAFTAGGSIGGPGATHTYWSARDVAEQGSVDPFLGDETEATDELEKLLVQSITGQQLADVPLGALLSGGIDSSTVVALMQAHSSRPVRTFTIGFQESGYDEAAQAKMVAQHLGTEHTEWYVTSEDALALVSTLPDLYDEPFGDSSQIPTHLVCALARRHVTVALTGDGGDELFGGYNRYFWAQTLWRYLHPVPQPLRRALAALATAPSPRTWDRIYATIQPLLPRRLRVMLAGDKIHKAAGLISAHHPEDLYLGLVSHWDDPSRLMPDVQEPPTAVTNPERWLREEEFALRMMYLDTVTYLPDDILTKVDRAAMAVSLETRVPLLDHRVMEFAWRLPPAMRLRGGQGKWLLRQLLHRYVPRELVERPKMGFGVPIDAWLRGPLRGWAEDLLDADRLRRDGDLDPGPIRTRWAEHLSGQRNWAYPLWDILMFTAWRERWR
ncbi:MAG TPA: asparagine synthase (glutamine-hydrolyzing) [Gammaproteobacteria bacterium]|nr:asparagine synthase (glutamine-hydrolyzing) [Gammaproteobacteria bacterium]